MPSAAVKTEPVDAAAAGWRARVGDWLTGTRARFLFGAVYVVAAIVTALAVWLVASSPASGGERGGQLVSQTVFLVLLGNLLLIIALGLAVGVRLLALVREQASDAGARLHLRFVTLFSLVAVVPAVLVALVFGVLVNRGVEGWFSQQVQSSVENSRMLIRGYLEDVSTEMTSDIQTISAELARARPLFEDRIRFGQTLAGAGEAFGYPAVYVVDGQGQVLARGELPGAPPYLAPPPDHFSRAAAGEDIPVEATRNPDVIRALYPLPEYGDAYLLILRPLPDGTLAGLAESESTIGAYEEARETRGRLQATFLLAYGETALLVLVGAVWMGLSAASAISAPVARLVQAAHRVASGDLSARVDSSRDPGEIAVLSQAFNKMTEDLGAQQNALKAASSEAVNRTRFIETVLSGVSAGVIGLDSKGRISAVNDQAISLLSLGEGKVVGKPLDKVAPELTSVARSSAGKDSEIDLTREGDTRRLRVRATATAGGEAVLTFDDITRLVTAQRNAAWRDVARRIAHEIKNPLTPIQLSAERLRRKYRPVIKDDVETFDRCTDTIVRQVGDIGRMVDEFSSFARMPAPKFAEEDAAETLREQVFARRVASPDVDVEIADDLPDVRLVCDGRMVGQALTNVLKNGAESVLARQAEHPGDPKRLRASIVLTAESLTYVVEDDGVGLPAKDRDRLTEPYVTNREKGTGLGLAIVKRIMEDHGGELTLADAVDLTGARICLKFPRNTAPSTGAETEAS